MWDFAKRDDNALAESVWIGAQAGSEYQPENRLFSATSSNRINSLDEFGIHMHPQLARRPRTALIGTRINRVHGDAIDAIAGLSAQGAHFFAKPFTSQRLFDPLLLARLQIEGMLFDVLDDVFLLDFTLEASESAFKRLAFV